MHGDVEGVGTTTIVWNLKVYNNPPYLNDPLISTGAPMLSGGDTIL